MVTQAIKTFRALQDASRITFGIVESDSRAQTMISTGQGAHDKPRFTRVGRTTKFLHEQVHAIWVTKSQDTVRTNANGFSNVEDVFALP